MTRVTVADMRKAGVCREAKHWFVSHNLDWRDFVRNGIDADTLLELNDARSTVERVVAAAKEREANG